MHQVHHLHEPPEGAAVPGFDAPDIKQWIDAFIWVARYYRLDVSPESLSLTGKWLHDAALQRTLRRLAKEAGLGFRRLSTDRLSLNQWRLPVVVQLQGGQVAVVERVAADGTVALRYSGDQGELSSATMHELEAGLVGVYVLRPIRAIPDSRVDAYLKPYEPTKQAALHLRHLSVGAGERIGVLGRNGAGKSTLLQLLSGLLLPREGEATLDGVALEHLDPNDVRRDVGLLSQRSSLFHGTVRENLVLGAPQATDEEILGALRMSGALEFVRRTREGLGYVILEGGDGLSGGQRQALLLARLILKSPNVVLLDEPTASLDETAEKNLIRELDQWVEGRTLVVATHRKSVLQIVDRILVVDNGVIVLDDSRDAVLARLTRPSVKAQATPIKAKG